MKLDWAFLRLVLYCILGAAALLVYPLAAMADEEVVRSVTASAVAMVMHLLLGYVAIELGFEKPNTTFLKIVLGGTVVRLLLLTALVFVLLKVYQFHALSLMLSLLGFYVVNLVLEISFLQKKVSLKN